MLNSIGLTISGLIFTLLISAIYFSKKKYKSLENSIYRFLLMVTIILLLLEFLSVYTMSIRDKIPLLNEFVCRLFILGDMVWFICIIAYLRSLVTAKKYSTPIEFFQEKFMIFLIVLAAILFFVSCFLKLEYTSGANDELYVIGGAGVYVLYGVFAVVAIYMFYVLLKDISKDNVIKRIPVFIFLVFYAIMAVVQFYYADINDLSFLFAFSVIAMYFTLENQDIKLVSELEIAKKEAEAADKAKTAFLSKMSHEIRTPMNTIMGFSEALMNEKNLTEETLKNDVKSIYKAGNNLLEIINNILDLSRLDSGKEHIENLEYSIKDIVYELNSFIYSRIDNKKVKFKMEIDENIPSKLLGDKVKIYRILSNILNNSAQHTNSGEIKLNIKCNITNNIANLTFKISDTGFGIKKEDFNRIFDTFSNNESLENNMNGVGLGLVVAKNLVTMLNGNIKFESEYGIGTSFYITLSQEIIDKTKIGKILENEEYISSSNKKDFFFDCSKYKILIVDDNKLNLRVAARLLEPYNVQVDMVESGETCIQKIKENQKYDLILLDHMMPNLDGIATLKVLQKLDKKDLPPVVAMTANVVTELKETYINEGFDYYIPKPIDVKALNKLMRKYFIKDKVERK